MNPLIAVIVQIVFILVIAPFVSGLVRFVKARLQGRHGASPFLPYVTLATLWRKEMVIPSATSWIFHVVPFVVLGSAIVLTCIMPSLFVGTPVAAMSDFLIVSGVLIIGSVFLVMGGLDTGSAFGGMGSSREMTIAALLEPVVIMVFAAFSFVANTSAIDGMLQQHIGFSEPYLFLLVIALGLVALAENTRYPVDNPATHLELTMVHEAMILEYSGAYLALLEYASAIKLTIFSLLVANFILPETVIHISSGSGATAIGSGLAYGSFKVVAMMICLAFAESMLVKMRFYRMSEYFSIAFVVALLGMIIALFSRYANISVQYYALFSLFTVVCVVLLFGRVRLKALLRYYAISSFAIAGIAWALIPLVSGSERVHLWIFAIFTILTKTIAVPYVINRVGHVKKSLTNLPSFLRPGKSYFLAIILLIVTYFIVKETSIVGFIARSSLLYAAVASIVLGVAFMIMKRDIFSQIIGLLIIENGIAILVLATVGSLPIMIEFGIFAVTLATAYILALLSAQIKALHGSEDTEDLRELIE